jgi:hypothetical protein
MPGAVTAAPPVRGRVHIPEGTGIPRADQAPALASIPRVGSPVPTAKGSVQGAGPSPGDLSSGSSFAAIVTPIPPRIDAITGQPLPAMPPLIVDPNAPWLVNH